MKKTATLAICLLLTLLLLSNRQDDDPVQQVVRHLTDYVTHYWQEKVYLHFDKPYYSTGETIWFNSYLVNAVTHHPEGRSGLLYVELIDPSDQIIDTQYLKVSEGAAPGSFTLPDSLLSGNYRVRAYTRWMRNFDSDYFFTKTFPVWSVDSTAIGEMVQQESQIENKSFVYEDQRSLIDLQFFPEGGSLIDGLVSLVAFKAVGPDGKSLPVNGTVVNQAQQEVAIFDTHHRGMGGFILKPTYGETYTARVTLHGVLLEFPLPEVQLQGYALRVSHHPQRDDVKVTVYTTPGLKVAGGMVVAHQRGVVFAAFNVPGDPPYVLVDMPRTVFPPGICHLTFLDATRTPQCERLLFINPPQFPTADITPSAESFTTRDSVVLTIALQDSSGAASGGQTSLTVTSPTKVKYEPYAEDIRSHLLLTSDLKGFIEQPTYYLEDTSEQAYRARDFLMLTQGWRRFRWEEVLSDSIPPLAYAPEQGFTISGRLVNFYRQDKPADGTIAMMVLDQGAFTEGNTDAQGRFAFVDNQFEDSTDLVLQARRKVGKKDKLRKDVAILLDEDPSPTLSFPVRPLITPTLDRMDEYLAQRRKVNQIDSAYNFDEKTIILEGVEVRGKKDDFNDPFSQSGKLYGEPSNRLVMDSIPGASSALSIFEMLRRVPGVNVIGAFPNQTAIIRGMTSINGSNEALFLLDGMPGDAELINSVSVQDVYYIDVLKGAQAAMYGARGANGVIAVYTRRGSGMPSNEPRLGITNFVHPGYSPVREFYAPRYGVKKPEHVKPDIRSTLYWNPSVVVDSTGRAQVTFYTSDEVGNYEVRLEGITEQGVPVVGKGSLLVQ